MNALRALRRRMITPKSTAVLLDVRGFHKKDRSAQDLLETIGKIFLTGYAHAAQACCVTSAEEKLERIPERFRGFAYEGAGMGFAMLDALPVARSGNITRFLAGRANAHIYMTYVGIGWAMARLPKSLWPDISQYDPVLRWLIVEGYGFHQAYFHTEKYVHQRFQQHEIDYPIREHQWYVDRAIDQGIGRALWFVGGTDVDVVTKLVDRFAETRRGDLYSGVGLAATYAGGVDEDGLSALVEHAASYRGQLARGSAFASEARRRANLLVPHTELAAKVLCGTSAEDAAAVSLLAKPDGEINRDEPAYELWRQRIAEELVTAKGSTR